jgi:predicted TIM-barrel fold metal-dependent hydrolase
MQYKLISVDDHVFESPDFAQKRVPAKLRDQAPKLVTDAEGYQSWVIEGRPGGRIGGLGAVAGRKFEDYTWNSVKGGYAGLPKSFYDAKERLKAMDQDGVDCEVLFSTLPGLGGAGFFTLKDPELRDALYRAYNDHIAEDWRGAAPERFVAQAILPLYDLEGSVQELRRAYEKGHRAFNFPAVSAGYSAWGIPPLTSNAWDPFFSTAQELGMAAAVHIGGGVPTPGATPPPSPYRDGAGAGAIANIVKTLASNIGTITDVIFSGLAERFPRLKLVSVESGIGWAPYLLHECDDNYMRQRHWAKVTMKLMPSEYARRQFYWNFWNEPVDLNTLEVLGEDNVMWESDFPHSISDFPRSRQVVDTICAKLTAQQRQKVLADNAVKVYQLR